MNDELLGRVEQLIQPLLQHLGYRLVEREYVHQQGSWVLRLYIERETENTTIDDCAHISRAIGDAIDVEGVIHGPYTLEISSPGIHRPLRYRADFERFIGSRVQLSTRSPIADRSHFRGILVGVDEQVIRMTVDGVAVDIPFAAMARANVVGEVTIGKRH